MLYPSDYFMLISVHGWAICHIKNLCSSELFSGTKKSRKLIAGACSAKGAVIDRIHDNVCSDPVCGLAVSDHKGSIAELADHTGCSVRRV